MNRAAWAAPMAALIVGLTAVACSSSPPGIRVTDARVPRPANGDVGVAYLTIHNTSADEDTLESVTSSVSTTAEVMRTIRHGLAEEMAPSGPIVIAGGATLTLRTGGSHLMLEHLRSTLQIGDVVVVTLRFDRAGTVRVRVPVVDPVAAVSG